MQTTRLGQRSALRRLKDIEITEPISLSELCKQHGISFCRSSVRPVLAELGIRHAKIGWPTAAGIRACVVLLPKDYDLAEYPHHTVEQRILDALPATSQELRETITTHRDRTISEALPRMRREGLIRRTNKVYYRS